ncbi:MAG: tetratricopeptide repeat protein [Candidatus Latescibacterota bacterium]|nr:MAG: tetratricopeptide repeat protein [Candidatus Latescibacterota bacterium]
MRDLQRKSVALPLALIACCALTAAKVERKAATLNRDATQAYEEQRFDEATDKYGEALTHAPESGDISYNLGNALYRAQQYEDAVKSLGRAAQSDDPELRHQSLHNLGNTFFQMGKLPEAVDAYRRALDAKPNDLDTKINFEKALQLMQQQEQQQQQQQQGGEQSEEQQEQGQDQQQGENEEQQNQDPAQDQQQPEENEQQEQDPRDSQGGDEEEQQEPQPQEAAVDSTAVPEGELRLEEALRILDAMRDQEEERQKEQARKARARARRVEKDW